MARVTIEDCLKKINNRFELISVASKRARDIMNGAETFVKPENNKPTVIALKEIASEKIDMSYLDKKANNFNNDDFNH